MRQAYLSSAQPRRSNGQTNKGGQRVLTDREREEVDANAKQMIRELNAGIRGLDEAEQLRRETEMAVVGKKYLGGLAALGSWASGGGVKGKSEEHTAAEAKLQQVEMHRDGVLWFLRKRLELCCRTQQDMMETRLNRELEKSRGMLSMPSGDFAEFPGTSGRRTSTSTQGGASFRKDPVAASATQGLTDEQVQMFEEGNQDMMSHYESALGKVR